MSGNLWKNSGKVLESTQEMVAVPGEGQKPSVFDSKNQRHEMFEQRSLRRFLGTFGLLLVLLGCFFLQSTMVEAAPYSEAIRQLSVQIEQLQADNTELRGRLQELEESRQAEMVAHEEINHIFSSLPPPAFLPPAEWHNTILQPGYCEQDDCLDDDAEIAFFPRDPVACQLNPASGSHYPTAELSGVFQVDAGWFKQDQSSLNNYGAIPNGVDFRRFRLAAKGDVAPNTSYFAQVDFGFVGRPTIQDLYVERTDVPLLGNVRIGQWKQPFSLEVTSSFRYTTFLERSVLFIPFTAFRHIGVGFYDVNEDEDMTWAASFFGAGNDQFGGSTSLSGGYGSAERITLLPFWDCGGREYLHLGFAHYFSAPNNHTVNFRTQPEAFVGVNPGQPGTSGSGVSGALNGTPPFVSTGNLHVDTFNVIGAELLWGSGRFTLQSEAMVNFVNTRNQAANATFVETAEGTAILPGAYTQVSYFLTDDYRPYNRKNGTIDRIKPRNSLQRANEQTQRGWGAWEVAARWSILDLNDQQGTKVRGGNITDYTLGVNWYTSPFTKVAFNFIHSISEPGTVTGPILATEKATTDIFMTRFQIDF